uniref:Uncharacterized protein n=1 Tax=Oryza sativa subsp. japonica TaxID=39947 RepID=Q5VSA4_ORYSJ|nr:hypothetical protein [Oryza sativa Japonica Group]
MERNTQGDHLRKIKIVAQNFDNDSKSYGRRMERNTQVAKFVEHVQYRFLSSRGRYVWFNISSQKLRIQVYLHLHLVLSKGDKNKADYSDSISSAANAYPQNQSASDLPHNLGGKESNNPSNPSPLTKLTRFSNDVTADGHPYDRRED